MTLPSKQAKIHVRTGAGSKWFGRAPVQARVRSMLVIVMLETNKLVLEVCCRPEEHLIKILSSYRANQSLQTDEITARTVQF
jgi:hypothetical protein